MESTPPQDTESRHADKYIVRFPDGMRDRLKDAAKANNRTMNAEIVARLQASFQRSLDIEGTAVGSDEVLTPEQVELVREAATAAAQHVVLHVQGLRAEGAGKPGLKMDPPPEPALGGTKKPA